MAAMDSITSPVDTFSNTFSSDQFAPPDEVNLSPPSGNQEGTSPESNPAASHSPHSPQSQAHQGGSTAAAQAPRLNPRSCVTCRKRKVRCDKIDPCTNCQKAGIECVFPQPGRAPRRSKKPPDAELLARLRRLEGVVQKLGKNVDGEDHSSGEKSPEITRTSPPRNVDTTTIRQGSIAVPPSNHDLVTNGGNMNTMWSVEARNNSTGADRLDRFKQYSAYKPRESGRLVVGEGRSRYVSNSFWAGLTEEIAEMRDLLNYSSSTDEAEEENSGGLVDPNGGRLTHQEFIFGYSSTMLTLRILHPAGNQIMTYWSIYKSNVDPVVRILHKPSLEQLFRQAAQDQSSLNKSAEALVFAVYLAVVTSLRPDECQSMLKEDRDKALKRYRYATEQALSRAGFLATQEIIVVQAFTLFLTCARRQAENKAVWTLTGLLLRMGHSLGVHRDGVQFGLSPFDTEMRRRLWWQICTLDVRASEDQGSEPLVSEKFFDTKLPLNINDSDIWPGMTDPPQEHEGCTEMTFDLVRYEIGGTIRYLSAMSKCPRDSNASEHDQLENKEAALERLRLRLENKYLKYCDMSEPLQWVAANVSRLVMAKIWLVIHHPFRRGVFGSKIAQETRDRTFLTSIDVIRYARLLETQQKTMKWGWLFKSYFQWHALAFLLAELCMRTSGPAVDDAWGVVEEAWPEWDKTSNSKKLALWKPIVRLMNKARAARKKELEKRDQFPADGRLGPLYRPNQDTFRPDSFMAGQFIDTTSPSSNDNASESQQSNQYATDAPQMLQASSNNSNDAMDVSQQAFNMLPAQPITDMSQFTHSVDGMGQLLDDPLMIGDPLLDANMNWAGWDDSIGMDFQNEMTQPINFNVDQLWGGA